MFEASEALAEKVHRLLSERRVLTTESMIEPGNRDGVRYAYVMGENQPHLVRATTDGVYCDCLAFRNGHRCAHQLAAMVVWSELLHLAESFTIDPPLVVSAVTAIEMAVGRERGL